ncbi:MAG: MBL fold metallo-hydrolase [Candidatus Andersenbacteria bacterium]
MARKLTNLRRLGIVLVICASVLLIAHEEWSRAQPRLVMLDIGQGDAIYLRTPDGQDILIDAGSGNRVVEQLSRELPFSDRTIELAVATHFDADHIGGFKGVLEQYDVDAFATNGGTPTTETGRSLLESIKKEGLEPQTFTTGSKVSGEGFSMDVVWPPDTKEASNAGSIVMRLVTAKTSALFTGDADFKVEDALLKKHAQIAAEILKVGHHGSKTSSSDNFLAAVGGTRALISVGATNRYGHPTKEALDRLIKHGYNIERTDQQGSITVPL